MNIIFEKATPEDALQLIAVQNESFIEDYLKYGECPSYQEKAANMSDMIKNAIVYKMIMDNEMIGDIIVRNRGNGCYYLRTISVIPKYQGLGIGTKAIEFIEHDNPDGVEWSLITPKQSQKNQHFYEKLGYKKVGEEYHSEKLTLIKYRKKLEKIS